MSRRNLVLLVAWVGLAAPASALGVQGPWAPPVVDLSAPLQHAGAPQVAVAPDGTTTVAWYRSNGTNFIIQAATRAPGGSFSTPVDLSAPLQHAGTPQVAVAPDGTTTVVWYRSNGANNIVQSILTANPPAGRSAPTISGTAVAGSSLACDGGLWSGAASVAVSWLREGTTVATGNTYTPALSDRGHSLVCRARATNPFGSAEASSAAVLIATQPGRPSLLALPSVRGTARVGKTIRCKGARFEGATKLSTRWIRNGRLIRRATRVAYRVQKADRGAVVSCRVRAQGPGGVTTVVALGVFVPR